MKCKNFSDTLFCQWSIFLLLLLFAISTIEGQDNWQEIKKYYSLCEKYNAQGKYKEAEYYAQKVFVLCKVTFGLHHPITLMSMNNLGVFYSRRGRYVKAKPILLQTLQLRKQKLGNTHPDTLTSMNNLAALYKRQGRYDKAEPLFLQTLQLKKQKLGNTHPDTLTSMNNLATLHYFQGRYDKAEPLYLQTLQLTKQKLGNTHPSTLLSMNNLARLYLKTKQFFKAKNSYKDWLNYRNEYLFNTLWGQSKGQHKRSFMDDQESLQRMLSLYLWQKNTNTAMDIFNYSLSRKGILLHFSSQSAILQAKRIDPKFKESFNELQTKHRALANLILNPSKKSSQEQRKKTIDQLKEEIEDLQGPLLRQSARFRNSTKAIKAKDIQDNLSPNEVCIDFLVIETIDLETLKVQPKKLIATIATKKSIKLVSLGKFKDIKHLIDKHRIAIIGLMPINKVNSLAHKLYSKLWKPLLEHLKNKQIIYLIPDGHLHLLPFVALVDGQGKYLIEDYNIQIISSARYLAFDKSSDSQVSDTSIIFAGVDYGKQQISSSDHKNNKSLDLYFKPLSGSAKEGQIIAQMLTRQKQKVQSYFKDNASKENLLKIEGPKILHIATHGFFLGISNENSNKDQRGVASKTPMSITPFENFGQIKPFSSFSKKNKGKDKNQDINSLARSGLAFAGANFKTSNKSIATALEIVYLDLWGNDLVVLSACDTSLGEVVDGEGVYSLRRAFQEAGAKAVLSTLWPASDAATVQLMKKFYRRYLDKVAPQVALHHTQLETIYQGKYAHPYYWANFVMVGIDKNFEGYKTNIPIPRRSRSNEIIWIIVISVLVTFTTMLFFVLYKRKKAQQLLRETRRVRRLLISSK